MPDDDTCSEECHLRLASDTKSDVSDLSQHENLDYIIDMLDSLGRIAAASQYGLMSWLIVQASIEGHRIKEKLHLRR